MRKYIQTLLLIISTLVIYSQPANNTCGTAQNLGTLPTPAACPSGVGASVNVVGTTVGATYPLPYDYLLGCQTGGNQPAPSPDVWYRFVASGNQVNINITPGASPTLANPSITLWSGSCGSLTGFNCDNNGTNGGNNTAVFEPLTPGQTYYIQISGSSATSTGNFNLSVNASNDCNNCLQNVSLTSTPNPVNGTYQPGQTVNFCLTITGYNQVSANWLHGVIPTFGNGWNIASLTTTPANSCSTGGNWQWATSNTSSATGQTTGPGFYYFSGTGGSGNNYGDNGTTCTRTFCWTIQTKSNCTSGNNLSISINTTADGETGSWTSPACLGDPNVNFSAQLNCCQSTATSTPPTCFGGTNGQATVNPTGVAPFQYSWNTTPVQITQTATGLSAGNYTATVTDNAGCVSSATVSLVQPTALSLNTNVVSSSCGQNNGSATVNVSGGTPPYIYSWNSNPIQSTSTATNLAPGNYTVTVTSAANCTSTATVSIAASGNITATSTSTNVLCNSASNGTATANPSGGSNYSYSWNTNPVQITQTATGLAPGNYTCTITSGQCQTTTTVSISQPPVLTAAITTTNVACSGSNNGSASVSPSGGVSPYTYQWNTNPVQITQTITNLAAGTYSVTVFDANNCQVIASANITQATQLNLSLVSSSSPTCSSSNNGQINVSASGGTGPTYFYSINGGTPQTSGQFSNLSAGTYTITVSDAQLCTQQIQVNLVQPFPISSTFTQTNVSCNGGNNGQIQLNTIGGTQPYTFNWSNSTTANPAVNLTAGTYSVIITDASNCQFTLNNITITQPPLLNILITPNPSQICIGQSSSITSIIVGGTTPYSYAWSSGHQTSNITVSPNITTGYTLQVSDANGCAISANTTITVNPSISSSISATQGTICVGEPTTLNANAFGGDGGPYTFTWNPGNLSGQSINITPSQTTQYTVSVSDGCSLNSTSSITISVNLLPVVSYTTSGLSGCEPLTVSYTNTSPNITNCIWVINGLQISSCNTTQTFNSPGTYNSYLTVTDANGCSNNSQNIIVNVYQDPVALFSANPLIANLLNPDVVFTNFSTTGSYNWSFGDGNFSSLLNPTHTYSDTGSYNVQLVVSTQFGCIDTATLSVYVSDIFSVYVPNAFTPNGDGKNDVFGPIIIGADYYEFWIFNRWGEEIFYSTTTGDFWDGTFKGSIVKQDVYIWKMIVKEKDKGRKLSLTGRVTVIK